MGQLNLEDDTSNLSYPSSPFDWKVDKCQQYKGKTLPTCASLTHLVKDIKRTKHKHFIHESSSSKPKVLKKTSRCDSPTSRNIEWESILSTGVSTQTHLEQINFITILVLE